MLSSLELLLLWSWWKQQLWYRRPSYGARHMTRDGTEARPVAGGYTLMRNRGRERNSDSSLFCPLSPPPVQAYPVIPYFGCPKLVAPQQEENYRWKGRELREMRVSKCIRFVRWRIGDRALRMWVEVGGEWASAGSGQLKKLRLLSLPSPSLPVDLFLLLVRSSLNDYWDCLSAREDGQQAATRAVAAVATVVLPFRFFNLASPRPA